MVGSVRSGQQGPTGRGERGRERLEKLLERDPAVGLTGHERAIDGREREARELVGDRTPRIVAERGRDLRPQHHEGTETIQALLVGRVITGASAFG